MPIQTYHSVHYSTALDLTNMGDQSVDLVVTSPPYPMIEMWDEVFGEQNPDVGKALSMGNGKSAFELMHKILDPVWQQLFRVVKDGGIVCINIGDATRTLADNFQLFSSHSRIISKMVSIGFQNLPNIIWRKTTNSPNKFMGSGMLPPGAYVTLEHEYVLIFRKGSKRLFRTEKEKQIRRESAYFWEERNRWFSDVWFDLKGTKQKLSEFELRDRSAAYPFELANRLINMFSVKGDTILDPFLGTGTTTFAAMTNQRNSIGYEIEDGFRSVIDQRAQHVVPHANAVIEDRLVRHCQFVSDRIQEGKQLKFMVDSLNVPCISRQECKMVLSGLKSIFRLSDDTYTVKYQPIKAPQLVRPCRVNSSGTRIKIKLQTQQSLLEIAG